MSKSNSLERLIKAIQIKDYDDAEAVLSEAQAQGIGSRQAVYAALAYAYQWYAMSIDNPAYMMQKFKGHDPEIKVNEAQMNNLFIPTIKLVFDFVESRYASRVTEYALVMQFVHRMMDEDLYADADANPAIVIEIIKEGGGIRKCADEQRKHNNPAADGEATQEQIDAYLQKACTKVYEKRTALDTINIEAPASSTGFLLMMGRVGDDGSVDVVEVMDAGADQIFNLTKDEALKDTSSLSDTLNLLADTLGYLHAFGAKDEPVVSVDEGGKAIRISLGNTEDASVVVTVTPKAAKTLEGFDSQAHLSLRDQEWFRDKAQTRVNRRLFDLSESDEVDTAEVAYQLASQIEGATPKIIHFNPMTQKTSRQVAVKEMKSDDWAFEISLDRQQLEKLYSYLKGWIGIRRVAAADRVLPVSVEHTGLHLWESGGSKTLSIEFDTGLGVKDAFGYRLYGRELAKVIEQFYANPNIETITMRAPANGLLEIAGEDAIAEYRVDIPTVLKSNLDHNMLHFTQLSA